MAFGRKRVCVESCPAFQVTAEQKNDNGSLFDCVLFDEEPSRILHEGVCTCVVTGAVHKPGAKCSVSDQAFEKWKKAQKT